MKELLLLLTKDKKFIIRMCIRLAGVILIVITVVICRNIQDLKYASAVNTEEKSETTTELTSNTADDTTVSEDTELSTDNQIDFNTSEDTEPVITDVNGSDITFYDVFCIYKSQAFEYYGYSDKASRNYADSLNYLASQLAGKSNVYSVIAPTSMGIQFPSELKAYSHSDNEKESTAKIFSYLDNVKPVYVFEEMMKHKNEYIFYKSDHHWTALGAYYAYNAFCKAKGIAPNDISDYRTGSYDNFYGTYYDKSDKSKEFSKPDVVDVYYPLSKNATLTFTNTEGDTFKWSIISDVTNYPSGSKYCTFVGADNPYSVINNPDVHNGQSCVLIKDSFGNAFAPFLTDHYEKVYIIDYRYWKGNLRKFAVENNVTDVIFCNSISLLRSTYTTGLLDTIIR